MAKNSYRVLTRPYTKKADIIRATLPGAGDGCHVYATCASRETAIELCRLLNLGLEVGRAGERIKSEQRVLMPKPKRKPRAR